MLLYPSMYYVMLLTHIQWHVASKIAPNNLCFGYLCPCVISPLNMGWNKWFTSKEQNMAKVMILKLQEDCGFHLGCSILLFHLFDLQNASCHVVNCPMKDHMAKNCRRSLGNRHWETEAPSPIAHKGLNSANNQGSECISESFPRQAFRWAFSPNQHSDYNLMRDHESEAPGKLCLDF